jgi:hypothetical protein
MAVKIVATSFVSAVGIGWLIFTPVASVCGIARLHWTAARRDAWSASACSGLTPPM